MYIILFEIRKDESKVFFNNKYSSISIVLNCSIKGCHVKLPLTLALEKYHWAFVSERVFRLFSFEGKITAVL